jgi:hypothetical protein
MGTLDGTACFGIPLRRFFKAASVAAQAADRGAGRPCACPRGPPTRPLALQVWLLLSVVTLSALPAILIEFRKSGYSVHYQARVARTTAGWRARARCGAAGPSGRSSTGLSLPPCRRGSWQESL